MKKILFILSVIISLQLHAQDKLNEIIQKGNDFYLAGEYEKAGSQYRQVMEKDPANTTARFNMANALIKLDKKQEASQLLSALIDVTKNTELKGNSWYNKGVILTKEKNLVGSIEAYKNALRQNPNDKIARENLQKALLELKKQVKPRDDKKNKPKKQDQQKPQPNQAMSPKEMEQKLRLLSQKEKEVRQKMQRQTGAGGSQAKDW